MRNKIILLLCLFIMIFPLASCSKDDGIDETNKEQLLIPTKENSNDSSSINSPVNSTNLDKYMFRDDVQYVDVRKIEAAMSDGYVAGFEFVPFYSIIASYNPGDTLYRMQSKYDENNKIIGAGQVGTFIPQFEESESFINLLFSKEKIIFIISQGGSECSYLINLLIQLGYDGNLLYNVGGVVNSEGFPAYSSIKTNKYYVNGQGNLIGKVQYDFMNDLTPINR